MTFGYRPVGTTAWQRLGSDDNAPYRVFHDVSELAKGTLLEYRAVLKDASGNYSVSGSYGVVGDATAARRRRRRRDRPGHPAGERERAGRPQQRDGLPGGLVAGLRPGAADARPEGQGLEGHVHRSPPASTRTRQRSTRRGTRTTGPAATSTARTSPTPLRRHPTTFYYEHGRHFATSDAQGPIVTVPGSFQSELGCPADWTPDCMRPWLTDQDGDGTYTWSTTRDRSGQL